ncbi:MAG: hypothetical protein JNJ61_24980 [Anaerolineae bacterium]|nr:hypothetical protein [Anaerolineae bacterium]
MKPAARTDEKLKSSRDACAERGGAAARPRAGKRRKTLVSGGAQARSAKPPGA